MGRIVEPTPHQLEALRAAGISGTLRRLPGGFWVLGDFPEVQPGYVPNTSLSTQAIVACVKRGWFKKEGYYRVHLTDSGRQAIERNAHVDLLSVLPAHELLSRQKIAG